MTEFILYIQILRDQNIEFRNKTKIIFNIR